MRFMIIRKADAQTEAGALPTTELIAAMGKYMEEMATAGILRGGDGLRPTSKGTRVTFSNGKPSVTDGPFAETKEQIAGYAVIEVDSHREAVEWTKKWPAIDAEANVTLEIREFVQPEDFGEAFTPELREAEDKLREQVEGRK